MDKGVAIKFDHDNGGWNEVNTQTNPDLVELVPVRGYYGEIAYYNIKAKENCWAYVTEEIQLGENWGDGADGVGGHATYIHYGYWQPLTKGAIYSRARPPREYTVYPIKK